MCTSVSSNKKKKKKPELILKSPYSSLSYSVYLGAWKFSPTFECCFCSCRLTLSFTFFLCWMDREGNPLGSRCSGCSVSGFWQLELSFIQHRGSPWSNTCKTTLRHCTCTRVHTRTHYVYSWHGLCKNILARVQLFFSPRRSRQSAQNNHNQKLLIVSWASKTRVKFYVFIKDKEMCSFFRLIIYLFFSTVVWLFDGTVSYGEKINDDFPFSVIIPVHGFFGCYFAF